MEMMNRAIEDAADYRGMMDKITANQRRMSALRADHRESVQETQPPLGLQRCAGENRAAHRARLKRERREAKAGKVPA